MKYRNLLYLLASVAILLPGCTNDIREEGIGGNAGTKGYIDLAIGDPQHIVTRSTDVNPDDCRINDAYLLVFGSDGAYKEAEQVNVNTAISRNGTAAPRIATGLTLADTDQVVVLCNTGVKSLPEDITLDNINEKFPAADWNIESGSIPMSGIIDSYTSDPKCRLTRSVAKIELRLSVENDVTGVFTTENVQWDMYNVLSLDKGGICNLSADGSITPAGLTDSDFNTELNLISTEATCYMPEFAASTQAKTTSVDITEFSADRTCMAVKAGDHYYRIDLFDHTTNKFIDIRRNTHITVMVTNVKSSGYTTMEEALAAPGSNLEYEVKVDSDYNVVASNGQYALAFDRIETFLDPDTYPEGAATGLEVAKGCYVLPAGMTLPSGITNKIEVTSSDPDNSITLHTTSLTGTAQSILITTTSATTYPVELTVTLGNIVRKLTVTKKEGGI